MQEQAIWTDEQQSVIQLSVSDRSLIEAGPGTGKTAVACARIAYLIDGLKVNPNTIMVISFTRAAVHEIRGRIEKYLANKEDSARISITTLDSLAGRFRSGFADQSIAFSGYREGIEQFIELLQSDPIARDEVQTWSHLLIDEAQDIVSPRAELLLDLIEYLDEKCGVTILFDDSQAIYGFAEDGESEYLPEGATLPDSVEKIFGENFSKHFLNEIHRTDQEKLLNFLKTARQTLKDGNLSGHEQRNQVHDLIGAASSSTLTTVGDFAEMSEQIPDDSLVLFRRRAEVVVAASWFSEKPFRLRLANRPTLIHPWIGILFGDIGIERIKLSEFQQLWERRIPKEFNLSREVAWSNLVNFAGESNEVVSLVRLAKILSRIRPPEEFCLKDYGFHGPIFGTIHTSKGRESDEVYLFLPSLSKNTQIESQELSAEAKVLFVGASRARNNLHVGSNSFVYSSTLKSQRIYRRLTGSGTGHPAQVEIGIQSDVDITGTASREYFVNRSAIEYAQEFLVRNALTPKKLVCFRGSGDVGYHYFVADEDKPDKPLVYLNKSFNSDLFAIRDALGSVRRSTPRQINNVFMLGSRTVVTDPDLDIRNDFLVPWKNSCFSLAPILTGFPKVYF